MACAKLALKQTLLEAPEFLSTERTRDILAAYFPEAVRSRYAAYLGEHSLGREIAATMICNRVINQAGAGLLMWTDGLDAGLLIRVVGAYLAFDQILEGGRLREQVCALDSDPATARRYELLLRLEDALAFLSRWALKRAQEFLPEPALVGDWRTDLQQYLGHLVESLYDAERPQFEARLAELAALGFAVPEAHRLAFLDRLRDFPILVDLSLHSREALRPVAKLADAIMELLGLRHVMALLGDVKARDRWECRLQIILEDRLRSGVARLGRMMLRTGLREPAAFFRQYGMQQRSAKFQHLRQELDAMPPVTLTPFAALGGELDALIDACGAASGYG
jgi:glutamate dehydrogenase